MKPDGIPAKLIRPRACPAVRRPWPIQVHVLGRFLLRIEGVSASAQDGRHHRPLDLLRAVVALGGRDVDAGGLAAAVWPHLEGDAARNALDIALHRLRKLLGHDTIALHDGKLHLNSKTVWVDVWAFERLCGRLASAQDLAVDESQAMAAQLMQLYGNHLLAGETAAWSAAPRERLRSRWLRAVGTLGARLEAAALRPDAISLYRQAIEVDPLAEAFHMGLMRVLQAEGRTAEAVDVYLHCRGLLCAALGVEPAAQTQALFAALKRTGRNSSLN